MFNNNFIIENWEKNEKDFIKGLDFSMINDLKKSGLTAETVKMAGLDKFDFVLGGLKSAGFIDKIGGQSIIQACSILSIPYFSQSGERISERLRIYPALENTKYLSQISKPPIPYILPAVWQIKDKKNKEIWVTEGEKKALRLVQADEFAISIAGIWNFRAGKNTDESRENKELFTAIQEFILPGRTFFVAFDNDFVKNSDVRKALFLLGLTIQNRGGIVKIANWDGAFKGIDDYLAAADDPADAVLKIKENAEPIMYFIEKNKEYITDFLSILRNIELNDILKNQIQIICKKAGILKKAFTSYLKPAQKLANIVEGNYTIPAPFRKSGDYLGVVRLGEQGEFFEPICEFFTIKNKKLGKQSASYTLCFDKKEITIDADAVGDPRKLAAELNLKLIAITATAAKSACDYIASFIYFNPIQTIEFADETGWKDDKFYAPTCLSDNLIEFSSDIAEKIKTKGSSEKQIEFLKEVFSLHCGASIVCLAGLATPLIKKLQLKNHVIFISGKTGSGKTLSTQIMLSLFGNPAENGLMQTLNGTIVGFELLLNKFKDIPVLLDETETAGRRADDINNSIINLIYNFQAGSGRVRSNKNLSLRQIYNFSGLLFLTSEHSITSVLNFNKDKAKIGSYRRAIEFSNNHAFFRDNVNFSYIVSQINKNYGHILPSWIKYIQENNENIINDFNAHKSKNINAGGKQDFILLLYIVYKYFCKMIDMPLADKVIDNINSLLDDNLQTFANEVNNEFDKYLNAIPEFSIACGKFYDRTNLDKDYKKPFSVWGEITSDNDDYLHYIFTKKGLIELCREYKFESERFLKSLKKNNILISLSAKSQFSIQKKIDGKNQTAYIFRINNSPSETPS